MMMMMISPFVVVVVDGFVAFVVVFVHFPIPKTVFEYSKRI